MKILKIAIIAALVLQFQGCMFQSVNNYDLSEAVEKCNGLDNIAEITAWWTSAEKVTCKNNQKSTLHIIKYQ